MKELSKFSESASIIGFYRLAVSISSFGAIYMAEYGTDFKVKLHAVFNNLKHSIYPKPLGTLRTLGCYGNYSTVKWSYMMVFSNAQQTEHFNNLQILFNNLWIFYAYFFK